MIEKIEQNQKTQGGIYAILNVHKDRIYIGQAINFSKRWKAHQNLLLKNKHRNKFLQNDFNKCKEELGHDDFLEFSVIEIVEDIKDKEFLTSREQVYLDAFIPEGSCYNIVKKAKIEDRSCFSKTPEETREKMSNASKKMWENPEYKKKKSNASKKMWEKPENIKKLSKSMKKAWEKPELREKRSNASKKMWKKPENIKKLSKSMKKAWENPEHVKKTSEAIKKAYEKKLSVLRGIVISPDGKEFEIYNICKFARENNLSQANITSLITKKRKSHKGWTLKK
jgi:group I intron endonuclease